MLVAMKCPICGGEVKLDSEMKMGECEYCGSPVVIPHNMEKIGNLYNLATFYRQNNEFDRSIETYKDILKEDSEEAEAYFGLAMSKYGIEFVEDPKSLKRIPTFHRTKEKSILTDTDYIKAIEYADLSCRSYYQEQGQKIAEIQNEILKRANAENAFDVFICYKESDDYGNRTEESVIGQELYYELDKLGIRTFYARLTLKPGEEYEPVIFSALRTAKVMLVVGCNPQNYNSIWVKNEWSRFLELRENEHKKMIIPCYKNMSPYELPRELAAFQALDMGKIGFLQDVILGIKKIVLTEPKTEDISGAGSDMERLCKNAKTFYELGQHDKAEKIYIELTDTHPDDYRGWWGLAFLKTNQFKVYSHNIYSQIIGNVNNAFKVAKEQERAEIQPVWDKYLQLKEEKEREEERVQRENMRRQYTEELTALRKKREAYEASYQADENRLPGLYQKRKGQMEQIQEYKAALQRLSVPEIGKKIRKIGFIVGIGITVFLIAGGLFSNLGNQYMGTGEYVSIIFTGLIMGAFIIGIAMFAAGFLEGAANTKNKVIKTDLDKKIQVINAEFTQLDQEIKGIEYRKNENDKNNNAIREREEWLKRTN